MDLGGSTKGGKKPLDAMINLVRLIDTVVKDGPDPLFPSVSVSPAT